MKHRGMLEESKQYRPEPIFPIETQSPPSSLGMWLDECKALTTGSAVPPLGENNKQVGREVGGSLCIAPQERERVKVLNVPPIAASQFSNVLPQLVCWTSQKVPPTLVLENVCQI